MNIETTSVKQAKDSQTTSHKTSSNKDLSTNFTDELKGIEKQEDSSKISSSMQEQEEIITQEILDPAQRIKNGLTKNNISSEKIKNPQEQTLDKALNGLNSVVKEFNQSEDKLADFIKNEGKPADNKLVINNEFNIQENKEILPQMTPNMNFSGDGQPFSSFMNDNDKRNRNSTSSLSATAQDLAEEAAILSTMAENIAIANKNQALKNTKTILNEDGIKKVDTKTGIKVENIVKFDSVIMNQADVEVFANLVENTEINLNNLAPKAAEKSIQISKTLSDLLAKAIEKNQSVRIDFDNDISVIIKISRDGKIRADFLPSSQVAEAYLKENLPLLRQRFDDNNINYDSLNQRERRDNKENNRKKERNNE